VTMRRLHSWSVCLLVAGLVAAGAAAEAAPAMPIHDASPDSTGDFLPCLPAAGGSCYLYTRYAVVAWGSPGQGAPTADPTVCPATSSCATNGPSTSRACGGIWS